MSHKLPALIITISFILSCECFAPFEGAHPTNGSTSGSNGTSNTAKCISLFQAFGKGEMATFVQAATNCSPIELKLPNLGTVRFSSSHTIRATNGMRLVLETPAGARISYLMFEIRDGVLCLTGAETMSSYKGKGAHAFLLAVALEMHPEKRINVEFARDNYDAIHDALAGNTNPSQQALMSAALRAPSASDLVRMGLRLENVQFVPADESGPARYSTQWHRP